jgi:hypothetical protein
MTDTTATPEGGATTSTAEAGGTTDAGTAAASTTAYWEQEAKKSFAKRDELAAKVKVMEGVRQEAERTGMEKDAQQGKFEVAYKKLLDKQVALEAKAKSADTLEAYVNQQVETRMATLPEDLRDVIPEGLAAVDRLSLIYKLAAHTTTTKKPADPPAPTTTAPANAGSVPTPGTPEWNEFVKSRPISDTEHTKVLSAAKKSWWKGRGVGS